MGVKNAATSTRAWDSCDTNLAKFSKNESIEYVYFVLDKVKNTYSCRNLQHLPPSTPWLCPPPPKSRKLDPHSTFDDLPVARVDNMREM